jgi:hypothetical protein
MKSHDRRLKTLEISLTPKQIVLLWNQTAIKGTFEQGARQVPVPREAISMSVARIVRAALKGHPKDVVEQAVVQARQEADFLYMTIIEINTCLQEQSAARDREYIFLLAYLQTILCTGVPVPATQLRELTLLFVTKILVLDLAISQMSEEHFEGQSILFSDSAEMLDEQLEMVSDTLDTYNVLADEIGLPKTSKEKLRSRLHAAVDHKTLTWTNLARTQMLDAFGTRQEFQTSFRKMIERHNEYASE